jgi:hypothetical protein
MDERPRDDTPRQPEPWGSVPTSTHPKRTSRNNRVGLIVIAVAVIAIAIAVTHRPANTSGTDGTTVSQLSGSAPDTSLSSDTAAPDTNQGDPLAVGAPSLEPTSQAPAVPAQVTYSCKGSAPDGVDITYGPEGSDHSASRLPFTHTDPLDPTAQYYVTTAQLQGGGSVSCTTVVQTDNGDGTAHQVTKHASADGGYNIASAEVCSTFDGGWDAC